MNLKIRGRLLVAFCLVLAIFFRVPSFSCASSAKSKAKTGPKAFFPEKEFNAGELLEGEPLTHTFTVINRGDEKLKILKVRPG